MSFLQGKKILVTGVLSKKSIAYGIASACHKQGAELAFSYADEKFKDRVADLAKDFNSNILLKCDVSSDDEIKQLFADLSNME
jgi:enoyl-[acyl-carrier protein] reductase I